MLLVPQIQREPLGIYSPTIPPPPGVPVAVAADEALEAPAQSRLVVAVALAPAFEILFRAFYGFRDVRRRRRRQQRNVAHLTNKCDVEAGATVAPVVAVPARLARPLAGIYGDVDFLQRRHIFQSPFDLRIRSVRRDGPRGIPAKGHGEGILPGERAPHRLYLRNIIIRTGVVAEGAPPQRTVVARPAADEVVICGMYS